MSKEVLTLSEAIVKAGSGLAEMKTKVEAEVKQYRHLQIISIEDKDGYEAVREAAAVMRSNRVNVEKMRKEFKKPIIEAGKAIDAHAKEIMAIVGPVEDRLKTELNRHEEELERRREEKRMQKLNEVLAIAGEIVEDWYIYGAIRYPVDVIKKMSFENLEDLKYLVEERKKEQEALAKEEARLAELKREQEEKERQERERLQKENEAKEKELQELRAMLAKQQRESEAKEKAEAKRREELEQEAKKASQEPKEQPQAAQKPKAEQEPQQEQKEPQTSAIDVGVRNAGVILYERIKNEVETTKRKTVPVETLREWVQDYEKAAKQ